MAADGEPPPRPRLRDALRRLADSSLALVESRVELASVEYAEERRRVTTVLALAIAGALCLVFALAGVAAFVVVLFWDTHRLWAIAGVTVVFVLAGAIALLRGFGQYKDAPHPFAATLAELEKDRAWLAGRRDADR
jgi:uncharacterized membrane protein YqjE